MTLVVNGQEFVTLLASPGDRAALTVGFLYDEGIIDDLAQITSLEEEATGMRIKAEGVEMGLKLFERRVLGSGCGKSLTSINALAAFSAPHRSLPDEIPWVAAGRLLAAGATTLNAAGRIGARGVPTRPACSRVAASSWRSPKT